MGSEEGTGDRDWGGGLEACRYVLAFDNTLICRYARRGTKKGGTETYRCDTRIAYVPFVYG